jgi:hypothetical protein
MNLSNESNSRASYAVQDAVSSEVTMRDGCGRTLVFARDVAAANAAHRALYAAGLDVLAYHRDVPAAQRADALEVLARCYWLTIYLGTGAFPLPPCSSMELMPSCCVLELLLAVRQADPHLNPHSTVISARTVCHT